MLLEPPRYDRPMRNGFTALALCAALILPAARPAFSQSTLTSLLAQAKSAYDREMAREKADNCRKAESTRDVLGCLSRELTITTADYTEFTGAIRSIIKLVGLDANNITPGPTGRHLTREEELKEFDDLSAAWDKYHKAQCAAAECDLLLFRGHMREMNSIYQGH